MLGGILLEFPHERGFDVFLCSLDLLLINLAEFGPVLEERFRFGREVSSSSVGSLSRSGDPLTSVRPTSFEISGMGNLWIFNSFAAFTYAGITRSLTCHVVRCREKPWRSLSGKHLEDLRTVLCIGSTIFGIKRCYALLNVVGVFSYIRHFPDP